MAKLRLFGKGAYGKLLRWNPELTPSLQHFPVPFLPLRLRRIGRIDSVPQIIGCEIEDKGLPWRIQSSKQRRVKLCKILRDSMGQVPFFSR